MTAIWNNQRKPAAVLVRELHQPPLRERIHTPRLSPPRAPLLEAQQEFARWWAPKVPSWSPHQVEVVATAVAELARAGCIDPARYVRWACVRWRKTHRGKRPTFDLFDPRAIRRCLPQYWREYWEGQPKAAERSPTAEARAYVRSWLGGSNG